MTSEPRLLSHVRRLVLLQAGLLEVYARACPESKDSELLLDYPKQAFVEYDGETWVARKHGVGVRFESETRVVDVPSEVGCPTSFDSDRVFDYLDRIGEVAILGEGASSSLRARLSELFEQLACGGQVERTVSRGHALYRLTDREDGAASSSHLDKNCCPPPGMKGHS